MCGMWCMDCGMWIMVCNLQVNPEHWELVWLLSKTPPEDSRFSTLSAAGLDSGQLALRVGPLDI